MSPSAALFALLVWTAAPAMAAEPGAAPCPAAADLSATPLAAWTQPDGDAAVSLAPGRQVILTLDDGAAASSLQIAEAGRYGVAADSKVWIDVIAGGSSVASVEHGHGPACSGIRKIVWFDLAAGTHQLLLSKAASATVRLLLVRAP